MYTFSIAGEQYSSKPIKAVCIVLAVSPHGFCRDCLSGFFYGWGAYMEKCILWTKAKAGNGYGVTSHNGKQVYAHRLAAMKAFGEIPKGMVVAHKCDTPNCVNPDHLFICTQKENLADMKRKGRSAIGMKHGLKKHPECSAKGEKVASSKLTESQIHEIRKMYVPGVTSLKSVGDKFGVAFQTISKIVNRNRWKHI